MKSKDRLIYSDPQNIQQNYANSIHLVDQGIERFYKELEKVDAELKNQEK